ncbi:MAG: AMP-binding protein [Bacteroidales bacterium]
MIEKYLKQTSFTSYEDFKDNYELIVPEHFNFAYDVLDEWARIEPNKRALLWTNDEGECKQYSFSDLKRITDKTASYFQELGLGKGDVVMAILKRRKEFWFTIMALHKIGAIIIPATHLLTKKDIVFRNNAADVKAIICAGEKIITDHVDAAMNESPTVKIRISVGDYYPEGWSKFTEGIENAKPFVKPSFETEHHDIQIISFTSGTSGEPKMVAHNAIYPLGHIMTGSFWHKLNRDSLHITIADTGWLKAIWGKLYGAWFAGATVFVYDHKKFTPSDILEKLETYKVTSICAPPTIFRFLIKEDLSKYDLSSLEWGCIAGEALNPSVYETFYKMTGIKLREGYGQSETTLTVFTNPWIEPKPGSMGVPSPAYDIDLLMPDGKKAGVGDKGQIVIRTDKRIPVGLFEGYYKSDDITKEQWHDGVYYTNDLAWKDEDGYFWFIGRADDVIKSSGYRIGPFEVESALMTHPAVLECAITSVPDEIRGQIVKATITLTKEYKDKAGDALVKELQNHVKKVTAPYKYPRVIEFVDELPKTISGKIRRVEIRNRDKNN